MGGFSSGKLGIDDNGNGVFYGFVSLEKPLGNTGHYSCNVWMLKDL